MAHTCQLPNIVYSTSHFQNSASQSTALMFVDGKQQVNALRAPSSRLYGSNDSTEFLKDLHVRVFPVSRIRRGTTSRPCRATQFFKQIGRHSSSVVTIGSHVLIGDRKVSIFKRAQRRDGALAYSQAIPRSISFLPAAGPLRDFLFATIGAIFAFVFAGILARVWCLEERYFRATAAERGTAAMPEMSSNPSQKESVEWVNMVIHKIWKVYRRSLEVWLVQLLQPAIDNLGKPNYVKRVEIAELNLDYEPIIVRNVQRRASRRANDLQYHFGLRYTGGARCLLNLQLGRAGMKTSIPVGVYDLDVDAELWLKLRLAPVKPYVGTLSLAFVRLPTIKLVLAPFRLVNLFSIPFLSNFLSKLLTVDLPRLLVLPRHITFDFLPQGQNVMDSVEAMEASVESGAMDESIASGVLDLLKTGSMEPAVPQDEPSEAFLGELSVTVCDARDLPIRGFTGWSNPYCILTLGDQVVESKRNKETSHPSGHKDPVWNQDFLLLVEDPMRQKLMLRVRDSTLTLNPNIGYCQINLAELKDCVPRTMWVNLKRDGPFGAKKVPGRVRLALTYKSYVDEEDDVTGEEEAPYIKVYGDSGAESMEEIGEEMTARMITQAKLKGDESGSDEEAELVSTQREDSSVEVTSVPNASRKEGKSNRTRNVNGNRSNGAASGFQSPEHLSTEKAERSRVEQGNGAVLRREETDSHAINVPDMDMSRDDYSISRSFGHDGDVRVPRWVNNGVVEGNTEDLGRFLEGGDSRSSEDHKAGVWDIREMERFLTRSPEAQEVSGVRSDEDSQRSSDGTFPRSSRTSALAQTGTSLFSRQSDSKDETFHLKSEAEVGIEETSSITPSKTEGNLHLLWLCMFTTVAYIIGCSLHLSNPLHP